MQCSHCGAERSNWAPYCSSCRRKTDWDAQWALAVWPVAAFCLICYWIFG